jgi:hypothetical protein
MPSSSFVGATAVVVRRTVTAVVFVIAALAFAFGFSNGWAVGLALGVPSWSAPLIAPAVDLSVVALLASLQLLRAHGVGGRLTGPRLLLACCGLITFALNAARPVLERQYGRACFDAVAPLLLIGWGEVGPRLLALMHSAVLIVPDEADETAKLVPMPEDEDGPSAELVTLARKLDAEHRATAGRPITRDRLRAALKTSNAVAGELIRVIRAPPAA